MPEQTMRWNKLQLRNQLAVIKGEMAPTKLLKNATYLNLVLKKWMHAHIWIYEDRIVYVGDQLPEKTAKETVDCTGQYLVPGYIEPHAHPFQLYNPLTLARYASSRGTTTLVNDNLMLFLQLPTEKALSFIGEVNHLPTSSYWWCRYDGQTEFNEEEKIFTNKKIKKWLSHPLVIQGGELTSWPQVLAGDNEILDWMQETIQSGKQIEGHLPGASSKTLTQMTLLGVNSEHEAMTGEEAVRRLALGYTASLRHSSIRPDLPKLLSEMKELGVEHFDRVMLNTDGSTPAFYEEGMQDRLVEIALEQGIDEYNAYAMVSYNAARHFGMDDIHGLIAPGRFAHINFLQDKRNPRPYSVLAKGEWVRYEGENVNPANSLSLDNFGFQPLELDWEVTLEDLTFSVPVGIEMINSVITKPYNINIETSIDVLEEEHDESFLMLIDKHGKWRLCTVVKGFADKVAGFASSFSNTGDIILIGKNKYDMIAAFQRLKEIGGGIVLVESGEVVSEIVLSLAGLMSKESMETLIQQQKELLQKLRERGYQFIDPIYSLLFFSATHLPYIRITQRGIFDVKNKTVLFPAIMR
ncbi:adenine deaminase C-terminal domain-containing protein [Bacillus taeanensis]|uniref:adenine deaminase n=1 Tax=Bacillus taeanensis TaxID=273032 RepID=A0A366XY64_9BACI|nr:adenine deaminase C-terminal domain-containing protein [Bacillus taeanensis]RBW70837.1 adenosine deaminase [Bacillus taeanensis]